MKSVAESDWKLGPVGFSFDPVAAAAEDENTDSRSSDNGSEQSGLENVEAWDGDPDLDPGNRLDTANCMVCLSEL